MNDLLLWPNFGAEEREPETVPPHPRLEPLAAAWSFLFAGDPVVENVLPRAPDWLRTDKPAFDFLDGARGLVPWLSTKRARVVARERGLRYDAPRPEIVRKVGDKGWAIHTAQHESLEPIPLVGLPCAFSPSDLDGDAVLNTLRSWPEPFTRAWTLKPRHGSSGRGRVKGRGLRLDDAARNALRRLRERGGAVLEPWCDRDRDLSAQFFIDDRGPALLGTLRQHLTASGIYLGNSGRITPDGACRSREGEDVGLPERAMKAAEKAHEEGLRGPIGIDAFTFDTPGAAATWLRPLVEVNARVTTGIVALGVARRAWQAGLVEPPFEWMFSLQDGANLPGAVRYDVVPGEAWLWVAQQK